MQEEAEKKKVEFGNTFAESAKWGLDPHALEIASPGAKNTGDGDDVTF